MQRSRREGWVGGTVQGELRSWQGTSRPAGSKTACAYEAPPPGPLLPLLPLVPLPLAAPPLLLSAPPQAPLLALPLFSTAAPLPLLLAV
jgi:hypothetical protein